MASQVDLRLFFLFGHVSTQFLRERLLKSVLKVAHLEDTLCLNASPVLFEEAPLSPLINNQAFLNLIEEFFFVEGILLIAFDLECVNFLH